MLNFAFVSSRMTILRFVEKMPSCIRLWNTKMDWVNLLVVGVNFAYDVDFAIVRYKRALTSLASMPLSE